MFLEGPTFGAVDMVQEDNPAAITRSAADAPTRRNRPVDDDGARVDTETMLTRRMEKGKSVEELFLRSDL